MSLPLYQKVVNSLLHRIGSGEFPPEAKLPPDPVLEEHYQTSRITILRALQELQKMGLVRRVRGHGTFVAAAPEAGSGAPESGRPVKVVAVVFPQSESFGAPEILRGIEQVCSGNDYLVGIKNSADSYKKERGILEALLIQRPSGIILFPTIGSNHNTDLISRILAEKVPLVVIDRKLAFFNVPFVSCDNRSGAMTVTKHLLARPARRIAFVGNSLDVLSSEQDRFAGYCQALAEAGISVDMELVFMVGIQTKDYDHDKIREVVDQLAARKVDAVFAVNDLLAITLIRALKESEVRVPEDMAVAGFDDIDFARHMRPGLTTFRQPFMKIGMEAATLLQSMPRGEGSAWSTGEIRVQGSLIVRTSA